MENTNATYWAKCTVESICDVGSAIAMVIAYFIGISN